MADLPKGNSGPGNEPSMEKRLLLAFILMGAVLFLTPYFMKTDKPAVQPAGSQTAERSDAAAAPAVEAQQSEAKSAEPPSAEPVAAPVQSEEAVAAAAEERLTVETNIFKVTFSNKGAVVTNWVLKDYNETPMPANGDGQELPEPGPLDLVNQVAVERVGYPFQMEFTGQPPALDPNTGLFAATKSADGLGVEFELSDGVTTYRKTFRFESNSYLAEVTSSAVYNGAPQAHFLVWRGGFGDVAIDNAPTLQHTVLYDTTEKKLVVNDPDEAEDGAMTFSGDYTFAGLEDKYFAAVALRNGGPSFQLRVFADLIPYGPDAKDQHHPGAGIGGLPTNEFSLFVGPKDLGLLKSVDPRLQQLVDFGWFSLLAKPIFLALQWVHTNWVGNWGWAIVLVTLAINILLFPLKLTSMKSMKQMQVIQPEVKKIQDRYKGLSMRDPKKQQQNEELMALYKKHNVNPAGGCLPMVLQIPFFFAFYKVLTVAIELRGADWLWVADLSQPETLPIRILPVTMVASQFLMQKMTPTTAMAGPQARMMYMMPLMMGFLFYGVSSGLVLYWLTSNVVGVVQQQVINKLGGKAETPAEPKPEPKSKKKGRKK